MIRERSLFTTDAVGDVDTPFIELTVCPAYDVAYKDEIIKTYGMDKSKYRKRGVYFNEDKAQNVKDLHSIFKSITYDINETLSLIDIYTTNSERPMVRVDFSKENVSEHIKITTKYWDNFGRCYSLHLKDHVLELGVRVIQIVARIDVYTYFGYPGQFMHPDTKTKVFMILVINY